MAFWGRNRWLKEGAKHEDARPICPWEENKVESAGYRLSVGREYYVNGDGTSTVKHLCDDEAFVVRPGEFAFILTREKVRVSKASIGFISIRANLKFRGLVNVSGFQINPGFNGNLVFAVFNAGPRHINLRFGDEIFSVWLADLDDEIDVDYEDSGKIPNNLDSIPSDIINGISGKALTAYQLSERTTKLEKKYEYLKNLFLRSFYALSVISGIVLLVFRGEIYDFFIPESKSPAIEVTQPTGKPSAE